MEEEQHRLIDQAAKCRRIARAITDEEFMQRLNALAHEYEARAARLGDAEPRVQPRSPEHPRRDRPR
jgi:hypothetical protein